jgi:hypothetical protein
MIHDVRTETRWFTTKSHSTWHVLTTGDRALCRANIRPCGQTYSDTERGAYPLPIPRCLACLRMLGRGTVPALRDGETLDTAPVQRDAHVQAYLANRVPDARTFALNATGAYPANPRVTMRLTHREFVLFVANHSGHFTCEAGKRIAGELADGSQYGYRTGRRIECRRHEGCTATYDNGDGFYWVTTGAYASEAEAWADTVTIPPLEPAGTWTGLSWWMYAHGAVRAASQAEADNRAARLGLVA